MLGPLEGQFLRVPLDCEDEAFIVGLDPLDDSVPAPGRNAQPAPESVHGLVVRGIRFQFQEAQTPRELRARFNPDRVQQPRPVLPVPSGGGPLNCFMVTSR